MKKLLVICPFPRDEAAGQRLKYEQYFDLWEENGYMITVSSYMDTPMWNVTYQQGKYVEKILGLFRGHLRRLRDLYYISGYDIVYVFQWVTPFGSTLFERLIRRLSKRMIYDLEDNAMTVTNSNINHLVAIFKNPNKIEYLIKTADYVITSSPVLNDYCLLVNDKVKCTYISSSVNTDIFTPLNSYSNYKKITIGWTGTFSSKQYLDSLRNVFIELSKRCEFRLRVIGNFKYEFPEIDLEVIQWSKENEVQDLQGIDIGVYPLFFDEWVLGKSGLKAIQYMAFGLPIVATDVGTTSKIISHLDNGLLVTTDEEWVEALEILVNDSALRRKLGTKARQEAVQGYSTNVIKTQYLSILNSLRPLNNS